jgi:hypothetical protein
MTFYLRRPVTLVDYWDEFTFGLSQQPELSIPKVEQFVERWQQHSKAGVKALAIISPEKYAELKQQGLTMRVVVQDTCRRGGQSVSTNYHPPSWRRIRASTDLKV